MTATLPPTAKPHSDLGLDSRDVVGRWLDSTPASYAHRIVIYREDRKIFLERTMLADGSSGKEELVESKSPHGMRFDPIQRSETGDHYLLVSSGDLELRDSHGLILTVPKTGESR